MVTPRWRIPRPARLPLRMKVILGLGNPGREYEATRHNAGWWLLDHLAARWHFDAWKKDGESMSTTGLVNGKRVKLQKPQTYMNLSGKAITYWLQDLKIPKENLLVIVDEIALPFGSLRMRTKGSAGGHNGLKNIELLLGGQDYCRMRFGVGNNFGKGQQVDYVLSNFTQEEFTQLPPVMDKAAEMIFSFCTIGPERTMNFFNS